MKKIFKIILPLLFIFFVTDQAIASCDDPQTIEEAVICSGGTYGVIDTSDSDSANNFVDMVEDQGLTNIDGGNCQSMNIKTGVTVYCELSGNNDAYYYYEGKKGEDVTVTVGSNNLGETFDISFNNQSIGLYTDNEPVVDYDKNTKTYILKSTLQYDGQYTIRVAIQGYENNSGEPFTIKIDSDKSGIVPDIREDSLIEGNKYSVYELNQNQSTNSRKFFVDAYVIWIYEEPICPKDAYSCPISLPPHIIISDNNQLDGVASDAYQAILRVDYKYKEFFEYNKLYELEVNVINTSDTNIPQNKFDLFSVKGFDESVNMEDKTNTENKNIKDRGNVFVKFWRWLINLF